MKNILLITADQWRGDCLGVAGHPVVRTPHLDRLAGEAVSFHRHYAGAAPCSPARACLYTGLYQMNNRVVTNGTPLDSRHDNLALAARRAGYDPTLFGYTDQGPAPTEAAGDDPRLRTYEGVLPGFQQRLPMPTDTAAWMNWLYRQGIPTEKLKLPDIHFPADGLHDPPTQSPPLYADGQTETAFVIGELSSWLHENRWRDTRGQPGWFAHVSLIRPHPPFAIPEPWCSLYSPDDVPPFAGTLQRGVHPFLDYVYQHVGKEHFMYGLEGLVTDWDSAALRTIAALYYGMISEVDAELGKLFETLKMLDQWDNTLIIFTSDHGEQMGDHHLLGKLGYFDASYHIPLIIRDPLHPAAHGTHVELFTESVDIKPTLLDWIDAPVTAHLDGHSLYPALTGEGLSNWRDAVHWEYDFRDIQHRGAERWFGIDSRQCNMSIHRSRNYKYVHCAALPPLLFDLQEDPDETRNLAEDPASQPIRQACAEALLSWRAVHLDQQMPSVRLSREGVCRIGRT